MLQYKLKEQRISWLDLGKVLTLETTIFFIGVFWKSLYIIHFKEEIENWY